MPARGTPEERRLRRRRGLQLLVALLALCFVAVDAAVITSQWPHHGSAGAATAAAAAAGTVPDAGPPPACAGSNQLAGTIRAGAPPVGWTAVAGGLAPTATSGATAGSTVPSSTAVPAPVGLVMTPTGGGEATAWSGLPHGGGLVTVAGGQVVCGAASVRGVTQGLTVVPVLAFFDHNGQELDAVPGQWFQASATAWQTTPPVVAITPPAATTVALGFADPFPSAAAPLWLAAPDLVAVKPPNAAVDAPLHVSGNRILDGAGQPVSLRGVDLYGLQSSSSPPSLSEDQVDAIRAWGANVVRISLGEQLWLTSSCHYDPDYEHAVDQVVHWVTQAGMVALLDLHFNAPGPGCQPAGQQPMADLGSITFWHQVAARYGANPLVAFDLYNEPHDISDSVWLDGGPVQGAAGTYQAAGMQQLYDAVRSTGTDDLVVVTGNAWGQASPPTLVSGTNVVYSDHLYTCPVAPPPTCWIPNPTDPAPYLGPWTARSSQVPVILGEFGWPSQDSGAFNTNTIAYAESHGWGWIAFAWDGTDLSPFDLVAQLPAGGYPEPGPSGMPVLGALAGVT